MNLKDTIITGHRANIFSAKYLPNTSTPTIVSCAGDRDIRVFEVERLGRADLGGMGRGTSELWGGDGDGYAQSQVPYVAPKRVEQIWEPDRTAVGPADRQSDSIEVPPRPHQTHRHRDISLFVFDRIRRRHSAATRPPPTPSLQERMSRPPLSRAEGGGPVLVEREHGGAAHVCSGGSDRLCAFLRAVVGTLISSDSGLLKWSGVMRS